MCWQIDSATEEKFTNSELVTRAERLAAGLQNGLGVGKCDVISILSLNHIDYMTSLFATLIVSATLQPLNPLYTKGKETVTKGIQTITNGRKTVTKKVVKR